MVFEKVFLYLAAENAKYFAFKKTAKNKRKEIGYE